ncbi:MAG: sugar phosphate isomerase/epimerase [Lentisphaeraceae bacterium]|nr:sugar phosphate isomerase/epimerase [Lentisphaeraceae bacterium]
MKRRDFINSTLAATGSTLLLNSCASSSTANKWQKGESRWPICLDTATLSGKIPLEEKVELAAKAGFDAIEPWDKELKKHIEAGKSLKDLNKKITDLGMFVPSVIGLWGALAPDKETFNKEIDDHKRRMAMVADVGAEHVQVIPKFGRKEKLSHDNAAWAYSQVCQLAKEFNLTPAIIFLNFVKGLERMNDAADIALISGEKRAQIIPDTYHMFLANSPANALRHLDKNFIAIFQFADAGHEVQPSNKFGLDGQRVLPGDGKLPLVDYLKPLKAIDYEGCISLELYNKKYHKLDPAKFLDEALRKTVKVVSQVDA